MRPGEYVEQALKTEHKNDAYHMVKDRMSREDMTMLKVLLNRIVHTSMQLDMWKKKIFYGSNNPKVVDQLEFAKAEHGYLFSHLESSNHNFKNIEDLKYFRLLHAIVGIVGEAGELAEAFSKYLKTGKLDEINLKEEFGDIEWYEAIGLDTLRLTHEEVWRTNNEKLKARYGDRFSEKSAVNRNLKNERRILETK